MDSSFADATSASHGPSLGEPRYERFIADMQARDDETARVDGLLTLLGRLVDLGRAPTVCVVGCGPAPQTVRICRRRGLRAVGVEPVAAFVSAGADYLGDPELVLQGAAETIPMPSASQDIILMESVMEHVDSPSISLAEAFRVLRPGGVLYIETTNRHRISLLGRNDEFRVPFYNWLPALVKESYVHHQLNYDPTLAELSERPAVHWFTFAELCRLGREAGFAHFYSPLDLRRPDDVSVSRSRLKRFVQGSPRLLGALQRSPWLRALALTQLGGMIIMRKRES